MFDLDFLFQENICDACEENVTVTDTDVAGHIGMPSEKTFSVDSIDEGGEITMTATLNHDSIGVTTVTLMDPGRTRLPLGAVSR